MSQRNSTEGVRRGWRSVPICDDCWDRQELGRITARLKEPDMEACYYCGALTRSGIFVRRQT